MPSTEFPIPIEVYARVSMPGHRRDLLGNRNRHGNADSELLLYVPLRRAGGVWLVLPLVPGSASGDDAKGLRFASRCVGWRSDVRSDVAGPIRGRYRGGQA